MASSLYLCPPEIISYIFELACLDDGHTVRSLSLVAQYLRQLSRPYLYQSLMIVGFDKISALESKLDATPPHLRVIRHLFISTHKPESTSETANDSQSAALLRVLTLAAPTLETLSFVASTSSSSTLAISRLFRTAFPRLRELSVSGFYSFPSSPGKMPRLERLHLHGNRNPHGLFQLGVLEEVCPSLTHLRVSSLSMAVSFAGELQDACSGVQKPPFSSKLPPRTKTIIVQPAPPSTALFGRARSRHQLMMEQLEALKPPKGLHLHLLPAPERDEYFEIFKRGWAERVSGEESFWAIASAIDQ